MLDGLAAFQQEAVSRIVDRLTDPNGSHRFLLADEVGLGKTRVAAGVIQAMPRKHNGFTVVYVCSNSEIAEQNRNKLCPDTQSSAVTRLALLAPRSSEVQRQRDRGDLQLFSFTPGTSFHVGGATGIDRERQLLLYLLARVWGKRVNRGVKWRRFFRCTCKWEDKRDSAGNCIRQGWGTRSRFGGLRHEFIRKLAKDLQQRLRHQWNVCPVEIIDAATQKPVTKRLPEVLDDCVDAFARDENKVTSKNRNRVIGALRHGLSQVALEFLQPDLVVLDEFQRFSEVLEESNNTTSIVGRLFAQKGMAALILSATPYKMYTQHHEDEDHYKEFIRTLRFLYACHCVGEDPADCACPPVKRLRENLNRFKSTLSEGKWFTGPDQTLLNLKGQIESDLKVVMCRTERNWYLEGHKKGVDELGVEPPGLNPSLGELTHYVRLRQFLLQQKIDDWNIMDFWKSAPSPLSFMDAHYALIKRLRDRHVPVPPPLLQSGGALSSAGTEHLKVRTLTHKVLGPDSSKLKFLWVKPSYTYYTDELYHEEDPAKFLVFSHWKFVPKAASVLLSHEAEKRLVTRRRGRETIPLAFRPKISFSPFDICYPSPALADCVNPADLALERAGKWTADDLYRHAEQAVSKMLEHHGIRESSTRSVPLWRIIARIEATSPHADTIHRDLRKANVVARDEVSEQYQSYQHQYAEWMADKHEKLHISPPWRRRLTLIALYSPAVCLLRSMRSVFDRIPEWEQSNWSVVLKLGLNQLRNYFNKQVVQSIVRANSPQEKSYSARVLLYCRSAHVQAMWDEYAYLVSMALPQSKPDKLPKTFLLQLERVLGMGTGSPSVNVLTRGGRIRQRPSPRPAHFAVAFGDDVTTDTTEKAGRSRKTAIREAFNSPFWPFVLATTSVGQEGLDFHLYCRDIMHWNLPSNPVDLEQREGRINRFDCLSIRRAIVSDHPLSALAGIAPDQKNIWARLFELLRLRPSGTQRFKHGLYPHWIYQPAKEDGQMLRRHLAFYSRSRDALRYDNLKAALSLYRLVLGQPRQQDIIESLLKMFPEANPSDIGKALVKYTINLSPIPKGHAARMAEQEARDLVGDPQRLSQTLEDVRQLAERESTGRLQPVLKEIQDLLLLAADGEASPGATPDKRIQAIAALLYLLNPYDDLYDFHDGIGYQDDIAQIRQVHASLFAAPDPKHETAGIAKDLRIDLTPPKCA